MGRRKRRKQEIERDGSWEPTAELQHKVDNLAGRWSRDRPEYREDLYQEGLLAIWLKGETEAPRNHQLYTAQMRMLSVRKLGKSVDGKLDYTYRRPRAYLVSSLEQDGIQKGDHTFPFQDILPDPCRVEEYVMAKLTFLEIISFLDPEERQYLALLCQGFTLVEVANRFQKPYSAVRNTVRGIQKKLQPWLRVPEQQGA